MSQKVHHTTHINFQFSLEKKNSVKFGSMKNAKRYILGKQMLIGSCLMLPFGIGCLYKLIIRSRKI